MKINYILTLILVFCIGASIPILTGSSQVNEQHSAKSEVPYCVTPPTVPTQVTDRRDRSILYLVYSALARIPHGASIPWY